LKHEDDRDIPKKTRELDSKGFYPLI